MIWGDHYFWNHPYEAAHNLQGFPCSPYFSQVARKRTEHIYNLTGKLIIPMDVSNVIKLCTAESQPRLQKTETHILNIEVATVLKIYGEESTG